MNNLFTYIDRRYAKICVYAAVTALLTVAVAMVLYFASPVFATMWNLICAVVEPMVYGAAISYVLNPLVKRVSKRLRKVRRYSDDPMKRRAAAVVASIVAVVLLLLVIVLLILLMITHSIASLNWATINELLGNWQGSFSSLLSSAETMLQDWGILRAGGDPILLTAFNGAKNTATTLLFAVIFGIYFLIDGPRVSAYIARVGNALFGGKGRFDVGRYVADADRVFSGYFRSQATDALIVGALSGILLTAVGVPYGPLIGLLTGLGNLIPYVGGPVGFGLVALMCLPTGDWTKMLAGFVVMAIVMFVDGNIINPRLLSDNVEVHPILVIAALIAGGAVGGIAGMLVAVPTAAFLKIQLDRWLESRERAQKSLAQQVSEQALEQAPAQTPEQ